MFYSSRWSWVVIFSLMCGIGALRVQGVGVGSEFYLDGVGYLFRVHRIIEQANDTELLQAQVAYEQVQIEREQARIERTVRELTELRDLALENTAEHTRVLRRFLEIAAESVEEDGQIDMAITETFVDILDELFGGQVFSEDILTHWLEALAALLRPMRMNNPHSDLVGLLGAFVRQYLSSEGAWLGEALRSRARALACM